MNSVSRFPAFLENSCIIVCHPDDEVLWFGSILKEVDQVFIAYEDFWAQPQIGGSRANALKNFPRPVNSLKLAEAGSYGLADWSSPEIDEHGIVFKPISQGMSELKRRSKVALNAISGLQQPLSEASIRKLYHENYFSLLAALRPILKKEMNVFTHNPWGEYGHEDHIQMFRVLDQLRSESGFKLWMSNYCSERSLPLAKRYFQRNPGTAIRLPVNKTFCDSVANIYKEAGCWTWSNDWVWFDEECFLEAPKTMADNQPQRHLFPINMFTIEEEAKDLKVAKIAGISAVGFGIGVMLSEVV